MPSTPTSPAATKRLLVATYEHPSYDDPWDAVKDYERVKRYSAAHPQQGSYVVSKALGLPRGRIQSWVDGDGMPDCYRGVQTALSNGWLPESWDDDAARALNCLSAWILSSGSINEHWVPTFVADSADEVAALRRYAGLAEIRLERTRELDSSRPAEWIPTTDASVLGRVLHTWTNVKGDKSREVVQFPAYLQASPRVVEYDFARIYVQQRGIERRDRVNCIQLGATRTESFRKSLKSCLQRVVDDEDEIAGNRWPLRIYGDAIETLRQYPEYRLLA